MHSPACPPDSTPKAAAEPRLLLGLDHAVTALAVLMIPVIIVEETATTPATLLVAEVANWVIWLGFLTEVAAKLLLSRHRVAVLRGSWLELGIVVLTPPFIAMLEPLSPIRTIRALRLLRFVRLLRLGLAGLQLLRGLRLLLSRHRLSYAVCAMFSLVLIGATAVYLLEAGRGTMQDFGDALWWATVTATTVGYGDVTPQTGLGRAIAVVVMLVGISFVSLLTANIAAYFVEARQDSAEAGLRQQLEAVQQRLDALTLLVSEQARLGRLAPQPTERDPTSRAEDSGSARAS